VSVQSQARLIIKVRISVAGAKRQDGGFWGTLGTICSYNLLSLAQALRTTQVSASAVAKGRAGG